MAVRNRLSTVLKILYAQFLTTAVVALVFFVTSGWEKMFSPFMGCLIALIPNMFFAYKVYSARKLQAQGIVNAFYTGEVIKLIVTAALFILVLQIPHINFLTLLIGYIAVLSIFWFALFYWRD